MNNPLYNDMERAWRLAHDCYEGTRCVKEGESSQVYLPMYPSELKQKHESQDGKSKAYQFRKTMARYENFFRSNIDEAVGIMQKNPAKVMFGMADDSESPKEVCDIEIYGNRYNDGLIGLKQRVNHHQALYGRYGMLLDILTDEAGLNPRFCITEYIASTILDGEVHKSRNGKSMLSWALLDESTYQYNQQSKLWQPLAKYRVLGLDERGIFYQSVLSGASAVGDWAAFDLQRPPEDKTVYPSFKGQYLDFIPFTVCNVDRLGIDEWQAPPYLEVAYTAISHYQTDSMYKKMMADHAAPTLVVTGRVGNLKEVTLGGGLLLDGDGVNVQLLETSAAGLSETRSAKQEMRDSLRYSSPLQLIEGAGSNSSGEALRLRSASGTSIISVIDQTGARAIEEQLIYAAIWAGATPEEAGERITYKADIAYLDEPTQVQTIVSLILANGAADNGKPLLAKENLYALLEKSFPGLLSSFDDNEAMKEAEYDMTNQGSSLSSFTGLPMDQSDEEEEDEEPTEDDEVSEEEQDDQTKDEDKEDEEDKDKEGGKTK